MDYDLVIVCPYHDVIKSLSFLKGPCMVSHKNQDLTFFSTVIFLFIAFNQISFSYTRCQVVLPFILAQTLRPTWPLVAFH